MNEEGVFTHLSPSLPFCLFFFCVLSFSLSGKLNYLGSSHQWWHLMVVLAFGWGHHLAVEVYLYWKTHQCPAIEQDLLLERTATLSSTVASVAYGTM